MGRCTYPQLGIAENQIIAHHHRGGDDRGPWRANRGGYRAQHVASLRAGAGLIRRVQGAEPLYGAPRGVERQRQAFQNCHNHPHAKDALHGDAQIPDHISVRRQSVRRQTYNVMWAAGRGARPYYHFFKPIMSNDQNLCDRVQQDAAFWRHF